jgi:2-iminobutanoate/2-iminopropanoate deaminase
MVKFVPFSGGVRPFSTAVQTGNTLYDTGQVGIDRSTGTYPAGAEKQTKMALQNLKNILAQENYSMANVVKMTVLLTNIADLAAFNSVYSATFPTNPPARTLSVVQALVGPAIVELEAVAYKE